MSGSIFFRRRRILRRLVCLAIMAGLLIWPSPWVTLKPILDPVSVLASTLDSAAGSVALSIGSAVRELRSAPFVSIRSGPIVIPLPMLPVWPFSIGAVPQVRMVDRIARVSAIKVSPHRMVAYVGETRAAESVVLPGWTSAKSNSSPIWHALALLPTLSGVLPNVLSRDLAWVDA